MPHLHHLRLQRHALHLSLRRKKRLDRVGQRSLSGRIVDGARPRRLLLVLRGRETADVAADVAGLADVKPLSGREDHASAHVAERSVRRLSVRWTAVDEGEMVLRVQRVVQLLGEGGAREVEIEPAAGAMEAEGDALLAARVAPEVAVRVRGQELEREGVGGVGGVAQGLGQAGAGDMEDVGALPAPVSRVLLAGQPAAMARWMVVLSLESGELQGMEMADVVEGVLLLVLSFHGDYI